jgi:hypothetical protein
MTTVFKKFATGTAALALMTTVFASTTMAADSDINAAITGTDSVTISEIGAGTGFTPTKLTGKTVTINSDSFGSFEVTDARGTGAGWDISISAEPFTNTAAPEGKQALSTGSLTLSAPTVGLGDDNSSPINTITTNGGAVDNSSVSMLRAETNGGMGTYKITGMPMQLKLMPKEVYAGTYTSTVTVSLTTGP